MTAGYACAWRPRVGVAASVWAWLFALAHVYWACGGRIGLTPAQTAELQVDASLSYVLGWAVGISLFAVLGLFPLALVRPGGPGDAQPLQRAALLAGYSGMLALLLYGSLSSDQGGLVVIGSVVSLAGAVVGLLRPRRWAAVHWMVLVATLAFGVGMLVYGLSYFIAAALSADAATRAVYAVTGGLSWTGQGALFVATGYLAVRCQSPVADRRHACPAVLR